MMKQYKLWLWAVSLLVLLFGQASAQTEGAVKLAKFKGPVTPILQAYIDQAITDAENTGAAALVIELDTPGGSVDITKQITQRMTASRVPVIVYVAPAGAHAGSAGTFITLAGHAAAMAPGSSIGAASPVGSEGVDLPDTLKKKATNILVADIKNLAARRGEKATAWAEKAVAEAAAATADEALALGVIDIIARDVPDLLQQLDGRTVTVAGEEVTLARARRAGGRSAAGPDPGLSQYDHQPGAGGHPADDRLERDPVRTLQSGRLRGRGHRRDLFAPGVLCAGHARTRTGPVSGSSRSPSCSSCWTSRRPPTAC